MNSKHSDKQVGYVNPANMFTLLRIPLAILGIIAYQDGNPIAGVVLISLASLTDMLDGQIARRFNFVTEFGALFDRAVDKAMMLIVAIFSAVTLHGLAQLVIIGIGLVEILNFSVAVYYLYLAGKQPSTGRVDWRGRGAMFARMTSVSALLLAHAAAGQSQSYLNLCGVIVGVIGIVLGLVAFVDYVQQGRNTPARHSIE